MIKIGSHILETQAVLAPMAGVTDHPFRKLCRQFGAALTPSEMISSNLRLWNSEKSRLRRIHDDETEPRVVQIAGSDPDMMAESARLNVEHGAQIIDINMGCPMKKVLKRSAGSALLKYPDLVKSILSSVVSAVDVPVTLKIRTGWDPEHRNGVDIARLAQDCGIRSLAVHGRTRACLFRGDVEYDTIAAIKASIEIPVFANGDINTPEQAKAILDYTGADGLMIGRAAQGRPWIFDEINHYLAAGTHLPARTPAQIQSTMHAHLSALHDFYGPEKGVLFARKHTGWYLENLAQNLAQNLAGHERGRGSENEQTAEYLRSMRQMFNRLQDTVAQLKSLDGIFQPLRDLQEMQEMQEKQKRQKKKANNYKKREQQIMKELAA